MGSGRGAERSSREQGVLGKCGTMTQARRETPGGAGGVANDDPALGVQRGSASSGPAEGPWRVREGGASPERRAAAQGSRGATPGERQPEHKGAERADCAGCLVSRDPCATIGDAESRQPYRGQEERSLR